MATLRQLHKMLMKAEAAKAYAESDIRWIQERLEEIENQKKEAAQ